MATADDNVPEAPRGRRLTARSAVRLVGLTTLLLLLFQGSAVESAGRQIDPGVERSIVLAVGKPAGWIAGALPFEGAADRALAFISPDDDLSGQQGFDDRSTASTPRGGIPPVTSDYFDPVELRERAKSPASSRRCS